MVKIPSNFRSGYGVVTVAEILVRTLLADRPIRCRMLLFQTGTLVA